MRVSERRADLELYPSTINLESADSYEYDAYCW